MSLEDTIKQGLENVGATSEQLGRAKERLDIVQWLMAKGAVRHSMVPGFYVLYTEHGPIDITIEQIGRQDA